MASGHAHAGSIENIIVVWQGPCGKESVSSPVIEADKGAGTRHTDNGALDHLAFLAGKQRCRETIDGATFG